MKKVLFGLFISFILSLNVFAEEIYEMSRIDLGDTGYEPIILEEKLYLMGDDYDCSETNCNLYFINEKNEIEKADKKMDDLEISIMPFESYILEIKKNEDGSYDLYSCHNKSYEDAESCKLIEDIDVSLLIEGSSVKSEENKVALYNFLYVVKSKDNQVAIYDGKGNKLFDFGNYEILGDIEYSEDGITAIIAEIVLKDKDNASYYFMGAENKVVTITKELAEQIGLTDEKAKTLGYVIDKYYRFNQEYETLFFTLNDGLLNNKAFDIHSTIKRYNNKYIIEEVMSFYGDYDKFNLYDLDGNSIIEQEKYHQVYYFDNHAEIVLAVDKYTDVIGIGKFKNSNIDVHDGEKVVYSKELEIGDQITDVLIDEDDIWLLTDDGEFKAIYIFRKTKTDPTVEPEPTPEKDPEPEANNSCKKIDGKYYDKNGKETTKEQHEKECLENPDTGYIIPFIGGLLLVGGYILIKKKPLKRI